MVLSLRKWFSRFVFVLLFGLLFIAATGGYRFLVDVISPVHPYKTPKGDALKVFQVDPATPENGSVADRLRWFYWYGE